MAHENSYGLERFLQAQEGIYVQAQAELRTGKKRSHWMWFIFPQIQGLGSSEMAIRYAISSLEEAHAYLEHPILGMRLRECTDIVLNLEGKAIGEIFGYPDDLKFHSSMTLFAHAAARSQDNLVFRRAVDKYFAGKEDAATVERI